MPQRTTYNKAYYQINKDQISVKRRDQYTIDTAYKESCWAHNTTWYRLHTQWVGLLSIDPHLFEN